MTAVDRYKSNWCKHYITCSSRWLRFNKGSKGILYNEDENKVLIAYDMVLYK